MGKGSFVERAGVSSESKACGTLVAEAEEREQPLGQLF
jgi:hypothetical protein